jgi:UDPglucose 6-dehydrogenase
VRLDALFAELVGGADVAYWEPHGLEVLSWTPERGCHFADVSLVCRRFVDEEVLEIRTKMGRRVTCTADHPFVSTRTPGETDRTVVKEAGELDDGDWLPLAIGASQEAEYVGKQHEVLAGLPAGGLVPEDIIVRPLPGVLQGIERAAVRAGVAGLGHPRGAAVRAHDIMRSNALRLHEAQALDLPLLGATAGTARSGTYVPLTFEPEQRFWRVLGLYLAEGNCSIDGGRYRLTRSFHPSKEDDLVDEVRSYWEDIGVQSSVRRAPTAVHVSVSSRILGGYWLGVLGAGVGCYDHRLPDLVWGATASEKQSLLSGLWQGDGSWSLVAGGPSVVLEYGTVSRALADGVLRLLGELGIVARLKVGRSRKSTCDTYWLTVSGADQVERLLDLVPEPSRRRIRNSLAAQTKRIAPTGYRRSGTAAWVRVVSTQYRPYRGWVYSLEVPGTETFVTTGGLVTHNCLPKDVAALKQLAGNSGYHFQLLTAVIEVNELQKRRVLGKLSKHVGALRGKTVSLLGLAFKPNTNDMREASSLVLAARLLAEGATVRGFDPAAVDEARKLLSGVELYDDLLASLEGADAAIVVTEWDEVKAFPFERARAAMAAPVLIDGRNVLDPGEARAHGFAYESIGRPSADVDD